MNKTALSDRISGPTYMILSCVIFAILWALIRHASATLHPFLLVFYRSLFGVLVLAPFFLKDAGSKLRSGSHKLYIIRGITGLVATYGTFYAVANIPLADAVAISYGAPIFAAVGAIFFLDEKIRARRFLALGIGFIGMLLLIRPGFEAFDPGYMAALIASIFIGASLIVIKKLSASDKPEVVVFYSLIYIFPISFVVALFYWQWPTPVEWGLLILMGALVSLAHILLVRAFSKSETTEVLPLDFVRLLLATLFGVVLFGEAVDLLTLVGAAIILGSTVYTAHREAIYRKRKRLFKETDSEQS